MGLVGHVVDEWEMLTKFYSENHKGRGHMRDLCVDRLLLKWNRVWTELAG